MEAQKRKTNELKNELERLKEELKRKQALLDHLISEMEIIQKKKLTGENSDELISKIDLLKKELAEL